MRLLFIAAGIGLGARQCSAAGYPDGPAVCCREAGEGCACVATMAGPADPGLVLLYVWFLCVFAVLGAYASYRSRAGGRAGADGGAIGQDVPLAEEECPAPLVDGPGAGDGGKAERTCGYRPWLFGSVAFAWVKATSALILCVFFAILVDTYHECQFGGVDKQCFFGNLPVTGSFETNANIFFGWWVFAVCWYAALLRSAPFLANWFREPCAMAVATHVWVWRPGGGAERMGTPETAPGLLVRRVIGLFSAGVDAGSSATFEVRTAPVQTVGGVSMGGERYIDIDCGRLLVSPTGLRRPATAVGDTYAEIARAAKVGGLSEGGALGRLLKAGPNRIAFRVDGPAALLAAEFLTGIFFYQAAFYAWWFWDSYLVVACVEFAIVLGSSLASMHIKRANQLVIKGLTEVGGDAEVVRDGAARRVPCEELVAGDVLRVRGSWDVPCDMLLVSGAAVCNESGLTGESMPVAKAPRPVQAAGDAYDAASGAKHTLFAGTRVLQAREGETLAVVTATGVDTARGALVRLILKPPAMRFRYDDDFVLIFAALGIYAMVLFVASLAMQIANDTTSYWVVRLAYGMFTVSQVLSPLLPVSLQVGQTMSSRRLRKSGIFCLNPKRIAICGKVRVACFDKTGTITKEGLDFLGVQPCADGAWGERLVPLNEHRRKLPAALERGLACAHAVTRCGAALVGDEVEVRMLEASGWDLVEDAGRPARVVRDGDRRDALEILKRFEFDHSRMTMSVVVRDEEGCAHVFAKGAPERMGRLCPGALPAGFTEEAQAAAQEGCYVLAVATRRLGRIDDAQVAAMDRDACEAQLAMLGLVLFRNEVKADSRDAILQLKRGDVRPVMITGDSAQNGLYVARRVSMVQEGVHVMLAEAVDGKVLWRRVGGPDAETVEGRERLSSGSSAEEDGVSSPLHKEASAAGGGVVAGGGDLAGPPCTTAELLNRSLHVNRFVELAMTGAAYEALAVHDEAALRKLVLNVRIFARTAPLTKQSIVQRLIDAGLVVAMCGDGGNDCGALRAAHAGIALSEAEASVVSPFTSRTRSLMSVVDLLREGRCALATSFASFKFLILYGQIYSVVKLLVVHYNVVAPPLDYLSVDCLVLVCMSYAMTLSRPAERLGGRRPTGTLLGPTSVASALGTTVIYVVVLSACTALMESFDGYIPFPYHCANSNQWWLLGDNWESTVVFFTFLFMLTNTAFVFSFGDAFRESVWRNRPVVFLYAALVALFSAALLSEPSSFTDLWHIASRNYNAANTSSVVWQNYQAVHAGDAAVAAAFPDCEGGPATEDYGMPLRLRVGVWCLILSSFAATSLWEKCVVSGPVRRYARERFPARGKPRLRVW